MGEAFKCRDPGSSPFSDAVSDLAAAISPVCGLAEVAAKLLALRLEYQRRRAKPAAAPKQAKNSQPASRRRGSAGQAVSLSAGSAPAVTHQAVMYPDALILPSAMSLHELERTYQAVLEAISVDSAGRRREADQRYAAEVRKVDATLQIELLRLANERRRSDQEFARERELHRLLARERGEIVRAIQGSRELMRSPRHAAIATQAAQTFSTALVMSHQAISTRPRDIVLTALTQGHETARLR
jgi:hypothetical protein